MQDKRILIIDDDAELCEELSEAIKDEGYCVETATDSVRGASLLKTNSYAVVILDFRMPHLSAVDILKETQGTACGTKFILISGKPFVENAIREEKLSGRVSAVLCKPFDPAALLEKIAQLCP